MESLLLLARHYPPAISGGARRPSLLVEGLRKAGVTVFVVAPSLPPGEFGVAVPHPNRDPSGVTSEKAPRSLRSFARECLLWPDPDIRWCMRAAKIAAQSVPFKPDWILTTSPPESLHVAGAWLKKRLGSMWVADFRDTWLDRPHRLERLSIARRIGEAMLAHLTLRKSDLIVAVDPVVAKDAQRLGGRNVQLLPHFSPNVLPSPASLPKDTLNIVHAGSMELSDSLCRIEDLLEAYVQARTLNPKLHLHFLGRLSEREVIAAGQIAGVTLHGPKPYEEALAYIAGADALALVASKKMHVPPSKIVDYLATDKPIIACGDGPWKDDLRTPQTDPVKVLSALSKGVKRLEQLPTPQNADQAAHTFLELLRSHKAQSRRRNAA